MSWSINILLCLLAITLGHVFLANKDEEIFCLSNHSSKDAIAPIYKLETIDASKLRFGSWADQWNIRKGSKKDVIREDDWNFKNWNGLRQVGTQGKGDLAYMIDQSEKWNGNSFYISVLAQSASIYISAYENLQGNPGMIFQLDQINEKTGEKELRILHCQSLESSNGRCSALHKKRIELLENGLKWSHLHFQFASKKWIISKFGLQEKITSPQIDFYKYEFLKQVAVKTFGKPGIFNIHTTSQVVANWLQKIELSREFYQRKGKFCIEITWGETKPNKVDLNIYKSYSYKLVTSITQDVISKSSLFTFDLKENRNYRVELNTHASCTMLHLLCYDDIAFIKNCSNSHETFDLVEAEEGAELIGCQTLLPEKSNQTTILKKNCIFFKEQPFNRTILNDKSFCDENSQAFTNNATTGSTSSTFRITSLLDVSHKQHEELTTATSYNLDECKCQSESLPVGIEFLWSLVCLNFVIIFGVTIWWLPILKTCSCNEEEELY